MPQDSRINKIVNIDHVMFVDNRAFISLPVGQSTCMNDVDWSDMTSSRTAAPIPQQQIQAVESRTALLVL